MNAFLLSTITCCINVSPSYKEWMNICICNLLQRWIHRFFKRTVTSMLTGKNSSIEYHKEHFLFQVMLDDNPNVIIDIELFILQYEKSNNYSLIKSLLKCIKLIDKCFLKYIHIFYTFSYPGKTSLITLTYNMPQCY